MKWLVLGLLWLPMVALNQLNWWLVPCDWSRPYSKEGRVK